MNPYIRYMTDDQYSLIISEIISEEQNYKNDFW